MGMHEGLVALLTGAPGVAAIAADRVSWFEIARGLQESPQYPALLLTEISPGREYTHDGPDELDQGQVQFDCWALTSLAALNLARAVLAVMEAGGIAGGWKFHPAQLLRRRTDIEDLDGGSTLYRVSLDIEFFHEEGP